MKLTEHERELFQRYRELETKHSAEEPPLWRALSFPTLLSVLLVVAALSIAGVVHPAWGLSLPLLAFFWVVFGSGKETE
jgi:hypothetical protein